MIAFRCSIFRGWLFYALKRSLVCIYDQNKMMKKYVLFFNLLTEDLFDFKLSMFRMYLLTDMILYLYWHDLICAVWGWGKKKTFVYFWSALTICCWFKLWAVLYAECLDIKLFNVDMPVYISLIHQSSSTLIFKNVNSRELLSIACQIKTDLTFF